MGVVGVVALVVWVGRAVGVVVVGVLLVVAVGFLCRGAAMRVVGGAERGHLFIDVTTQSPHFY